MCQVQWISERTFSSFVIVELNSSINCFYLKLYVPQYNIQQESAEKMKNDEH